MDSSEDELTPLEFSLYENEEHEWESEDENCSLLEATSDLVRDVTCTPKKIISSKAKGSPQHLKKRTLTPNSKSVGAQRKKRQRDDTEDECISILTSRYLEQPLSKISSEEVHLFITSTGITLSKTGLNKCVRKAFSQVCLKQLKVGKVINGKDCRRKELFYINLAEKQEEFVSLDSDAQECCQDAITQIQDTLRSKLAEENKALKEKLKECNKTITKLQTKLQSIDHIQGQRLQNVLSEQEQQSSELLLTLSEEQKQKLNKEIKYAELLGQINLEDVGITEDSENLFLNTFFDDISKKVEEQCPLLSSIIKHLVTGFRAEENIGKKTEDFKWKCAVHVLFSLIDIRSQKSKSKFSELFGLMLICNGAGKTLLTMLEPFGLCKSYQHYMTILDNRLKGYLNIIRRKFPKDWPILIMYDNVNIYKGRARHARLKQKLVPIMWNFTVRAALKPNLSGIEYLWKDPEMVTKPQKDIRKIVVEDLFLETYPDLNEIKNKYFDEILIRLLQYSNDVDVNKDDLHGTDEQQLTAYLKQKFDNVESGTSRPAPQDTKSKVKISIPPTNIEYPDTAFKKSEVFILPLSIEDEASLCGTAAILECYNKEFGLGVEQSDQFMPYIEWEKCYNIKAARDRYKFYIWLKEHKNDMEHLQQSLLSNDRKIENSQNADANVHNENNSEEEDVSSGTFKVKCREMDSSFNNTLEELAKTTEDASLKNAVGYVRNKSYKWFGIKNSYGSSILHGAVEVGNVKLAETLLCAGAKVNEAEGCGATPLILAIVNNNLTMVKLLVQYGARIDGTFEGLVPSPLKIASRNGNEEIQEFLHQHHQDVERKKQRVFQSTGLHPSDTCIIAGEDDLQFENTNSNSTDFDRQSENCSSKEAQSIQRSNVVVTMGDQKTCSNIRSVRNRAPDKFSLFSECPGDFHTQGYIIEVLGRIVGPSGFLYVCKHLLARPKITAQSFKKIFQEGNFERNFDSLNDYFWGVGLAMILEFKSSEYYPDVDILSNHTKKNGNANELLIARLKDWLKKNSEGDEVFKFHTMCITEYIPLLHFFHDSVRNGCGKSLEAAWIELLLYFAGMGKIDYKDEAFTHVLNFTCRWSKAVREMVRRNRTISIKGKRGTMLLLMNLWK